MLHFFIVFFCVYFCLGVNSVLVFGQVEPSTWAGTLPAFQPTKNC